MPGLIPREHVLAAQRRMTAEMEVAGFLEPAAGERALAAEGADEARKFGIPWQTGWLQEQPEVMRVVEGPELFATFERLFEEPAATFDYKWCGQTRVCVPLSRLRFKGDRGSAKWEHSGSSADPPPHRPPPAGTAPSGRAEARLSTSTAST